MSELSGKERRALRALGHHLDPVVQVGKDGLTPALVNAAKKALADHELIKVRVLESSPASRKDAASKLAERTGSELAQVLGRTFLLYKADPEEPKIVLPGRIPPAALHTPASTKTASRLPRRSATQGAKGEGRPGPGRPVPRSGSRVALPPRRHGR